MFRTCSQPHYAGKYLWHSLLCYINVTVQAFLEPFRQSKRAVADDDAEDGDNNDNCNDEDDDIADGDIDTLEGVDDDNGDVEDLVVVDEDEDEWEDVTADDGFDSDDEELAAFNKKIVEEVDEVALAAIGQLKKKELRAARRMLTKVSCGHFTVACSNYISRQQTSQNLFKTHLNAAINYMRPV